MPGIGPRGPGDPGLVDPGAVGADAPLPGQPHQFLVEEDPHGKYVVLGVRDFSGHMSSYLRLGAASSIAGQWDPTLGEDLASLVQGFADDTRERTAFGAGANPPRIALDPRSPAAAVAAAGTLDPRRAESLVLHTKGGWRDHTDGNRITTTRGDKVEVIRGNYKLVVLGRRSLANVLAQAIEPNATSDTAVQGEIRQDPLLAGATISSGPRDRAVQDLLHGAAGFDMSGGLNDYGDDVHGDVYYASSPDWPRPPWEPPAPHGPGMPSPPPGGRGSGGNSGGGHGGSAVSPPVTSGPPGEGALTRGKTTDGDEAGFVTPTGHSPFYDQYLCVEYRWRKDSGGNWVWEKITTKGQELPFRDGQPHLYRVINNNYVDYEEDVLGSMGKMVDQVIWTAKAKDMTTETHVSVSNRSLTAAVGAYADTNVDMLHSQNIAIVANAEADAVGAIAKAQVAVANVTVQLPATVNLNLNVTVDAHVGAHIDRHDGAHVESHAGVHLDSHTGMHLEVRLGTHTDMHFATHLQFENDHVDVHDTQAFVIGGGGHLKSVTPGTTTVIGDMHTEITAEAVTSLATEHHLI